MKKLRVKDSSPFADVSFVGDEHHHGLDFTVPGGQTVEVTQAQYEWARQMPSFQYLEEVE